MGAPASPTRLRAVAVPAAGPPAPPGTGHRCADCGYGIALARVQELRCPMCRGGAWLPDHRRRHHGF